MSSRQVFIIWSLAVIFNAAFWSGMMWLVVK